jgi:flagellar motor switch protein FliN/FliY
MSPTLTEFVQAIAPRFVGVVQSIVSPDAEGAEVDGAVVPGWLVPVELSGALAGTCYFAFTAEDAGGLAARILMKEKAEEGEIGDSLQEVIGQSVLGISQNAPFTALTVSVGKPVTAPVAPGTPAGGFACVLDETTTVRVGCSFAGGAAATIASAPAEAAPANRRAASGAAGKVPDNLDLLLGIEMPLTVRFGEAVLTLDALSRLAPGSLLELGRQPDDPVEILINGRLVARGEVVVVAGNYGVRVTEVQNAVERMNTLNTGSGDRR